MDEDEDDFSPNNLVTRPPSPMGAGSSFFMDIFSSPSHEDQNPLEGDLSNLPSFHMQLNPPLDDGFDSQSTVEETSVQSIFLESNLQTPTSPSTPADILIDSSSPDAQLFVSRGTDGLEIAAGEDEELFFVESELNHSAGQQENIENYNKDFAKFCQNAYYKHRMNPTKYPKLSIAAADVRNLRRPMQVMRAEREENGWDYQAIPWDLLGISHEVARGIRRKEYTNYENIKGLEYEENPIRIPENRNFFNFRRMDNEQRCRLIHFQLRNLIGVISRNDVFYAGDGIVVHTNPLTGKSRTMMDLRTPDSWSGNPIRISTLGTCGGSDGVVIAGCFYGEYAMKPLHAPADSKPITGIVTQNESGITNHVQMIRNRTTGTPNAVFSSNDHFIRVLNCGEGMRFVIEHEYLWPVNCSVTSPDSRLRIVVGDDTEVLVCDAERGTTEFVLKGHRDFGFAAAWSDDGYTIATGNQDKTVRIWDARNLSKTVKVLPAVMAGVRTLRFSPIGYGGKRVLAMAEPADIVQIVDAVSWDSLQQIDFWGEVGGMDFDPSGEEFYIANADRSVGGIMEFSRTKGSVYYEDYHCQKVQQPYNVEKYVRRRRRKRSPFIASSDDDSESATFSDEEPMEEDEDAREELDLRKRGRYYDKRRYKRLGHDMSNVFV
ncbi:hypothetical protein DFP73DRAFT_475453 [Morchella snyderi]|nr:hypothetical protein DFP73DRAFT_475453 [Morchella snyderi]